MYIKRGYFSKNRFENSMGDICILSIYIIIFRRKKIIKKFFLGVLGLPPGSFFYVHLILGITIYYLTSYLQNVQQIYVYNNPSFRSTDVLSPRQVFSQCIQ